MSMYIRGIGKWRSRIRSSKFERQSNDYGFYNTEY